MHLDLRETNGSTWVDVLNQRCCVLAPNFSAAPWGRANICKFSRVLFMQNRSKKGGSGVGLGSPGPPSWGTLLVPNIVARWSQKAAD